MLATYPFSDPDPVPALARDPRLYPYHSFEGYAAESEPREWTVVTLENDLIEVSVLPEVGGKVWGAIVKETGHEFIYRNEVMKFRNIALRGPWTSGGIEFNFGVIGHAPATATPVDYLVRQNPDGSASCIVGAMDLPSRTHWRVEIRLPPDRATFETRVLWYNPTPLEQPYYNWMTAAAFARNDLELFVPGHSYLEHSGQRRPWPSDASGRYLPLYRNNAFGGNKSYHVVGELNDFFGGYYHDEDWGWGHWARYEEMPGQKMWIWALSRAGGIWEELLTDTDGQYVEFQAGRLLVQYAPGDHVNPVTQAAFDPVSASRWTETWFPLEGTGGLTDASKEGAMHVRRIDGRLETTVQAFGDTADTLQVWSGDRLVTSSPVQLRALEPYRAFSAVPDDEPFRVRLAALNLDYRSDPAHRQLSRPFETSPDALANIPEADRLAFEGRELAKARRYADARMAFRTVLEREPWNREALLGLAELALRAARYDDGLAYANRALQLDSYDARANFVAGNLYRATGRIADARDAFGWSARSTAYRSASYVQLAEIMLAGNPGTPDTPGIPPDPAWSEVKRYAELALDFDRQSIPARQLLAIRGRRLGDSQAAQHATDALLEADPLHHFVLAEEYLSEPSPAAADRLLGALRSEYPDQSLLELAVGYAVRGLEADAAAILELADQHHGGPVVRAWRAFLAQNPAMLRDPGDVAFAFPFRPETLPVLRWAAEQSEAWLWTYLLGLNLWGLDRHEEAAQQLASLGNVPDYGPAYAARAKLLHAVENRDPAPDLARAIELEPENRLLHIALIRHAQEAAEWPRSVEASTRARERFPGDFNVALLHARGLIATDRHREAAQIMDRVHVLPSENARESHRLYELAHVAAAADELSSGNISAARAHIEAALLWPESLGQGRPYAPDERLPRYLLGMAETIAENADAARRAFEAVAASTSIVLTPDTPVADRADLLAVLALRALGQTEHLAAIAAAPTPDRSPASRAVAALAHALTLPDVSPAAAAAQILQDYPEIFSGPEGRVIGRILALAGPPEQP